MARCVNGERVLTEVQLLAVDAPPGRLIFLGTPGSGKSTVVVERAIRLVRSGAAKPDAVLLLAPSRRAANALGRSVHERLGAGVGLTATSFHGLALAILRRHYRDLGYARRPELLSTTRHFHFLRDVLAEEDPALWPHHRGQLRSSALRLLAYRMVMGMAENGLDAAELQRRARVWGQVDLEDLAAFAARYRQRLRKAGLVDFGQLLAGAIELLSTNRRVVEVYHRTYRHILVDEFEQASFAHAAIVGNLLDEGTDLLVAGDPAQATNSFRSGSPSHLLSYPERVGARVVVSCENHRSRERIASLGAAVRPVEYGVPFSEETPVRSQENGSCNTDSRDDDAPGYVVLRHFTYPSQEAQWIGVEVESLLRAGIAPTRIAILFRSLATPVAKLIATELGRRRVPLQVQAGQPVGNDPLVRGAIAVLRHIAATGSAARPNVGRATSAGEALREESPSSEPTGEASPPAGPEGNHEDLLLRILESPIAGLPPFGLQELRRAAALAGRNLDRLELDRLEGLALSQELRAALDTLFDCLRMLRHRLYWSASSLLWETWRVFPAFHEDAISGGASSMAYAALLGEVASLEDERGSLGLYDFIALVDEGFFDQLGCFVRGKGGMVMTTVHQAKGQEWEVVFLPALVEGSLPSPRPALDIRPLLTCGREPDADLDTADAAAQMAALGHATHLAEEQRIFYVAVSRARRGLYLSYSQRAADGETIQRPSRFLEQVAELPGVEVVPALVSERRPSEVEDAAIHYRRLLRCPESLSQALALHGLKEMRKRWPEVVRPEVWWTNVAETCGAAPPFPDRRLHLSASRLVAYRECPLAYQFGYHWRLGEREGPALTIGSVLHAVLEDYHRPGSSLPRTREALQERLDHHFDESAFPYRPIAKQARRVLSEMIDKYYARYGQSGSVQAVEIGFAFAFGPHRISGYVDRVDRLPNGKLELIDYKTGQAMSKADAENDLQLALYDLAFCHDDDLRALGQPGLASYLYPKNIGARANGKRSYVPTDESRERLRTRVAYYSEAILAERFPPHGAVSEVIPPSDPDEVDRALRRDPCRFCAFKWICPETEREGTDG